MSDLNARIGFGDFRTEVAPLANVGLAQGSPLSPILFACFNYGLVMTVMLNTNKARTLSKMIPIAILNYVGVAHLGLAAKPQYPRT